MELPLDHFRLIGVSPSASSEEILRAFQLRLDKTPNEGFTYEVLTQRAELLRLTADLLTNTESRKQYENKVLNGASGLEFPSNREVAGLILLWESGSPKEAFKLARKSLQPPQTPALGSSREADLTLLAALTARDSASKEQDQRCYANAADFLQEGIHILHRMGKLTDIRKNLEEYLNSLLPYRILDFLSRDLSESDSHKKGISMLENLILKRGGLEGKNKSEYNKFLNQGEFEVFFHQIKPFLTVQEQIDLFLTLYKRGSAESGYLAFLSLTAQGFNSREPEKLIEAKRLLKNLNSPGFDTFPLLGCIDMLLANVKKAEARFFSSTDDNLKSWLNDYPGEKLEAICLYCKNWLENDVLKGFRDINAEKVDLDSWFEDEFIQSFIEKEENKANRNIPKAAFQKFGRNFKNIQTLINEEFINNLDENQNNNPDINSNLPLPGGIKTDQDVDIKESIPRKIRIQNKSIDIYNYLLERYAELRFYIGEFLKNYKYLNKSYYRIYFKTFLFLFVLGIGLSILRTNSKNASENNSETSDFINNNKKILLIESDKNNSKLNKLKINALNEIPINKTFQIKEINSVSLSLEQIRYLLSTWLDSKSQFLSGGEEVDISKIVKKNLILRLNQERKRDIKKNIIKEINTEILEVKYLSQSASRIAVEAKLKYSEKVLKDDGELISETNFNPFLKVKYIFGFSNKSWKLVDYISSI